MKTNTAKHTPGPWFMIWKTQPSVENPGWMIKQDDDVMFPICMVTETRGGKSSPQEANARLIAAAPELLEACKLAFSQLSLIPAFGDSIGMKISKVQIGVLVNKFKIAIVKAEGGIQ